MSFFEDFVGKIKSECGADSVVKTDAEKEPPIVVVKAESLFKVMKFVRDNSSCPFLMLQNVSGVDMVPQKKPKPDEAPQEGHMEVVYHLWAPENDEDLTVKVELPRENPEIDSVTELWSGANWMERETYDLVGITFKNHPDHRRILCPDDWEGHALRKDYVTQEVWRNIVVAPKSKANPWLRNIDVSAAPAGEGESS